jgi:methionyl-tRNA formyltransferase
MRDLRIVFMGTPDFAVAALAKLIEQNYTIAGVITAPDKPAGRGRKLQESAVKKYAKKYGLNILQPTNLKDPDFLKELTSLHANLQIVVAFRMLPKAVWQQPEYGTFNLHASLLPNYRGAAPINWAIMNGETETGVTTFFIDEKIDTGAVILQDQTKINPDETAGSLHDKLMVQGAELVLRTVRLIEKDRVESKKQLIDQNTDLKSAHKIHKETCRIDWKLPIEHIYNHIRGLSPYPAAWTTLVDGEDVTTIKVYACKIENDEHPLKSGTILFSKKELKVAAPGGYLVLLEIQIAGKKRMHIREVLNGLKLRKSAYMS